MKKILYSLLTLAAALTVASCQKEPVNASDPNFGGKPVTMAFDVNLGVATKAVTASVFDDGKTVDKLYVAAFDATSGALVSTSLVGEKATTISDGTATVKLTLAKGGNYNVVFFAMKAGKYTVNFADGNTATFAYTTGDTYKANDAENDAFYAMKTVTNAATNSDPISVELKRPFAQINVFSSNRPSETATFQSNMTVKQVPTSFNLFSGEAGTTLADLTFANNAIAVTSPNATYPYWIGMNYVLVPSAGKVDLAFQEINGMAAALNLTGITVKANNRTNLVGAIYALDADVTYNVTVGGLEGEGTGDIAGEDQTIVADNTTYTPASPLNINAATAATQSVTLSFNGNTIAEVEAGATTPGDKVTVESSDEDVATAAVSGNDVVITPVGNGDATITVNVPGYTKATYKATIFEIPVHVEGVVVPQVVTPAFNPAAGEVESGTTVAITTTTEGAEIYYTTDGTDPTANSTKYTAAIAITEAVTIKAIAMKEGMTTSEIASAAYTIAAPETTYDFTTVAELKALDMSSATEYAGKLTGAVVSFVPDTKNAVIKDNTGSILLYKTDHGLKQGQTFTGDVHVTATKYKELRQITAIDATFEGEETAVAPETVTLAQIAADYNAYESAYVKVVGMTSGTTTTAKGNINATQESTSYIVFTNVAIPINTGDVFTAEGTVTRFEDTYELKVWATDDLTITSAADVQTVISGVPSTKNMKPGESYTLAGTTNSGVAVTYAITTDANSVATLTEGVVSIAATAAVGSTVVITANAAATTGYTAAEPVTCTITVISADTTTPDPETFTFSEKGYDNAAEVTTVAGTNVNLSFDKGTGTNAPKYYTTGTAVRAYAGNTITVDAGSNTMSSIKLTFATGEGTNEITTDVTTYSEGTWTGSASKVVFTIGGTSGHRRIASVEVTFK